MGQSITTLFYNRQSEAGLETYTLKPMQNAAVLLTTPIVRSLNTLWHAAGLPAVGEGHRPLWFGDMQSSCEGHHPVTCRVLMLPIKTSYNSMRSGSVGSGACTVGSDVVQYRQGSFPAGTPGNGVPKVIFTVGTAFPGIQ